MIYLEVLCEGSSDVPAIREVLTRGLNLTEDEQFRIHPHSGKGRLPDKPLAKPIPGRNTLLDQLPIKLRNYGKQAKGGYETAVLVLVDADNDDCKELKQSLLSLVNALDSKPTRLLFRIAVEETESWFIADTTALKRAYPHAKIGELRNVKPDSICGAWEKLAEALALDPKTDADKVGWATTISPHLDFQNPRSPSLNALLTGIPKLLSS